MTMLHSNPYFDVDPDLNKPLVQYSESFATRIRDNFTYFLFYHQKKTFAVIGLLLALGSAIIICPWVLALPIAIAITFSVVGALLAFVTSVALYVESYLFGWDEQQTENEFEVFDSREIKHPETKERIGTASLEYFENATDNASPQKMPQLRIFAQTPEKAGFIQGYLLGKQGDEMVSRLKKMYGVLRLVNLFGCNLPEWGSETFTQPFYQHLPECLQAELSGVLEGHNLWAKENHRPIMSMGDLMMLHFLPDTHNLKELLIAGELLSSGCTAGLAKNADGSIKHFRNTDWPSYNIAKRVSLMIERHIGKTPVTRTLTFPLCIGCAFGENEFGLTLSINVSPGATVYNDDGTLAFLLYRRLLNECKTVDEVVTKVTQDKTYQPLGPCHLTVSDKNTGAIIRFYQAVVESSEDDVSTDRLQFPGKDKKTALFSHDVTYLSDEKPLIVVANDGLTYDKKQDRYVRGNHHDSKQRLHNVHQSLNGNVHGTLTQAEIHKALGARLVNNCGSVHTVIKDGATTRVIAANGFSGRFFPPSLGPMTIHRELSEDRQIAGTLAA